MEQASSEQGRVLGESNAAEVTGEPGVTDEPERGGEPERSLDQRDAEYRPSLITRIAEIVTAAVLGVVVGGIGTFAHQLSWSGLGFPLPIGLIAALVAVAAMIAGVRIVFESRLYAAATAAGVVGVVGLLALPSANGSVLFPDTLVSTIWAIAPTLVALVVLAWPQLPPRARPASVEPTHGEASGSDRPE